jgi:glycosyltransferase involved in cell wall biosynthesis
MRVRTTGIERVWPEVRPALIAVSSQPGYVRSGAAFKQGAAPGHGTAGHRAFAAKMNRVLSMLEREGLSPGKPRFAPVANGTKVTIDLSVGTLVMNPAMSPEPVIYTHDLLRDGEKISLAFVVSRIGGEDGVSLEAMHWMRILAAAGHPIHVITGQRSASQELAELERAGIEVHVIPAADPDPSKPENAEEFEALFDRGEVRAGFSEKVETIRRSIDSLIDAHRIDALMMENFTLPWHHLAMGVAVGSIAEARGLPVVSRGHDFPHDRPAYRWTEADPAVKKLVERVYSKNAVHVAINTRDVERYFGAMGIDDVTVVPNTIDTSDPRISKEIDRARLRRALLGPDHENDFVLVCPVRPVARKRLDVAIDFVRRLREQRPDLPLTVLVTHDTVDASPAELSRLKEAAEQAGVNLVFGHPRLPAGFDTWDQYRIADVALYFSDFEGFGNALLEMLAFELPVVINEYEIFQRDIAPAGFELMQVRIGDGDLGAQLDREAREVAAILDRKAKGETDEDRARAGRNRERLEERYSYPVVARSLNALLKKAISAT